MNSSHTSVTDYYTVDQKYVWIITVQFKCVKKEL